MSRYSDKKAQGLGGKAARSMAVCDAREQCFRYGYYHEDGTFVGIEAQGSGFVYEDDSEDPRPVSGKVTQLMLIEDMGSHYIASTLKDLDVCDVRVINELGETWYDRDGFHELVACFRDEGLVEDGRSAASRVIDLASQAMANLLEENDADTFALWDIEALQRRAAQVRRLREEARVLDHKVRRRTRVTAHKLLSPALRSGARLVREAQDPPR